MGFVQAVKEKSYLRAALTGASGSGKTFSALAIATGLGGRIGLIDTERGTARKYAHRFSFAVSELGPPYSVERYLAEFEGAKHAGFDTLIIDSLSHAWNQEGGMLERVDKIAVTKAKGKGDPNTFAAWKDATPLQNRFINAILDLPMHVIVTMRSKQEYVSEKDERGKTTIRKVGLKPEQRDGVEYEFDLVLDMDQDNIGYVTKSRIDGIAGQAFKHPGAQLAEIILPWLDGAPAAPKTVSAQQPASDDLAAFDPATACVQGGKHTGKLWRELPVEALQWYASESPNGQVRARAQRTLEYLDDQRRPVTG